MKSLLKTNLEARIATLSSSSTHLIFFEEENIQELGICLNQRQTYEDSVDESHVVIIHIFQGVGDFEITQNGEIQNFQATRGDIFSLPQGCQYKVINTTKTNFIASLTRVKRW